MSFVSLNFFSFLKESCDHRDDKYISLISLTLYFGKIFALFRLTKTLLSYSRAFREKSTLTYLPLIRTGLERAFENKQSFVTGAIVGIAVTKEVMKWGSDSKFRKY